MRISVRQPVKPLLANRALLIALLVGGLACAQLPGPRTITRPGPYRHAYTELLFAEHLGRFDRLYITEYTPDASNVSGHYQGPRALPSNATVYLYPATPDASRPHEKQVLAHFEQAKNDIRSVHPAATLGSEEILTTAINGFELNGLHAVYTLPKFPLYDGLSESHIYLYVLDGWYLKFRFSHPQSISTEVSAYEREFISAFTWPTPE
jgi:hypothetical protein